MSVVADSGFVGQIADRLVGDRGENDSWQDKCNEIFEFD
jgi:hypothetical protein